MTIYYAKSTNGFYATAIHGGNIPADAVEISAAEHAALLDGQSDGKIIAADQAGYPILLDRPPAPPVVLVCGAYQIRQALSTLGWRDAAEAAIAAADQELKDAWQYATEFRRDNPKIIAIAQALNKTAADIDALFELAITLSP